MCAVFFSINQSIERRIKMQSNQIQTKKKCFKILVQKALEDSYY